MGYPANGEEMFGSSLMKRKDLNLSFVSMGLTIRELYKQGAVEWMFCRSGVFPTMRSLDS